MCEKIRDTEHDMLLPLDHVALDTARERFTGFVLPRGTVPLAWSSRKCVTKMGDTGSSGRYHGGVEHQENVHGECSPRWSGSRLQRAGSSRGDLLPAQVVGDSTTGPRFPRAEESKENDDAQESFPEAAGLLRRGTWTKSSPSSTCKSTMISMNRNLVGLFSLPMMPFLGCQWQQKTLNNNIKSSPTEREPLPLQDLEYFSRF